MITTKKELITHRERTERTSARIRRRFLTISSVAERTPRKAVKANEAIKVEEYYRNARFQMTRSSMRKDSCLMTNFARKD